MRSIKVNVSAAVLTLGLKAKILENLRLLSERFGGNYTRTGPTFDLCVLPVRPVVSPA